MTRCLLDLNVVLDMVLAREPHAAAARALWSAAERKEIEAVVPAHGITTLFYIVARQRNAAFARRVVDDLVLVPSIASVDGATLRRALALGWPDFEDAVCAAAAEATSCDLLVTRDVAGFKDSPVLVVDPVTALSMVRGAAGPDRVSEGHGRAPRTRGSKRAGSDR